LRNQVDLVAEERLGGGAESRTQFLQECLHVVNIHAWI
jgi:hypothetical protein